MRLNFAISFCPDDVCWTCTVPWCFYQHWTKESHTSTESVDGRSYTQVPQLMGMEEATHKTHNSWEWKKLHTRPTTHGNGRSYTQDPQLMGMEEATHKSHNSWEWKKLHTSPTTHGDLLMEEATHKSHNSWESVDGRSYTQVPQLMGICWWKKLHTSPTTHGNLLMEEAIQSHNSRESVKDRSSAISAILVLIFCLFCSHTFPVCICLQPSCVSSRSAFNHHVSRLVKSQKSRENMKCLRDCSSKCTSHSEVVEVKSGHSEVAEVKSGHSEVVEVKRSHSEVVEVKCSEWQAIA
ncbi:hypothetical protein BgiMline_036133 [Biomphalaria glabrata]|nr:hypothetical protein BgiMline_014690 [Biomphalaria glabrata]